MYTSPKYYTPLYSGITIGIPSHSEFVTYGTTKWGLGRQEPRPFTSYCMENVWASASYTCLPPKNIILWTYAPASRTNVWIQCYTKIRDALYVQVSDSRLGYMLELWLSFRVKNRLGLGTRDQGLEFWLRAMVYSQLQKVDAMDNTFVADTQMQVHVLPSLHLISSRIQHRCRQNCTGLQNFLLSFIDVAFIQRYIKRVKGVGLVSLPFLRPLSSRLDKPQSLWRTAELS